MSPWLPIRHLILVLSTALFALTVAACDKPEPWHSTEISGALPDLAFSMTRADDGKAVTAEAYKGKVVLLFFGYTFCPDICPMTLSNITTILAGLGDKADEVSVLFVTVDPDRDTLPVLEQYVDAFAPGVDGLRGDPGELAALAKRYRAAYSVKPETEDHPYEVSHGSAVYVFDREGKVRLLLSSLASEKPDFEGATSDIVRLIEGG